MIISTKNADTSLRKAFNKEEVAISDFAQMLALFPIDPTTSKPKRDAFIVTSDDIKSPKVREQFKIAVKDKHPKTVIVFISKVAKSSIDATVGVDAILIRPKPDEIANTINELVSINADKEILHSSAEEMPEPMPSFKPSLGGFDLEEQQKDEPEYEPEYEAVPIIEEVIEPVVVTAPTLKDTPSELVERIRSAGKVADASILARELTAASVIKDVMASSQTYAAVEDKLKAIQNKIYTIMSSTEIPTLEEKLEKVRALLHDKAHYSSKGSTILEERIEGIIDAIVTTTKDLVESRLEEIDRSIINNRINGKSDYDYARLAGITEERANLIMELSIISQEIVDIAKGTDTFILDTVGYLATQATDLTGSSILNARLRLTNETIISDETQLAIRAAVEAAADDVPTAFQELRRKVAVCLKQLNQLFDLDRETIAAQRKYIQFLQANNIEDTVVAQTLIKKSLRVFTGQTGTGRTIIPYLMSYYKSRQNANVLLVDLTGEGRAEDYGLRPISLEDYYEKRYEKEFCYVAGKVHDTPSAAQRMLNVLIKAADYYRVINIVVSPEQSSLFEVLAPDVLCVNYIVEPTNKNMSFMKDYIAESRKENTAQRVIINKCNVNPSTVIHKLGLDDIMSISLCKIGSCDAIVDASVNGYNPAETPSVALAMDEVLRNVRT